MKTDTGDRGRVICKSGLMAPPPNIMDCMIIFGGCSGFVFQIHSTTLDAVMVLYLIRHSDLMQIYLQIVVAVRGGCQAENFYEKFPRQVLPFCLGYHPPAMILWQRSGHLRTITSKFGWNAERQGKCKVAHNGN